MYLGVFVGRYLGVFAGRYLGVFAGLYSGIFVLSGYDVRASTLFTAVALCELLKSSASSLWPWSLQYVQQSRQAMRNIQVRNERSRYDMMVRNGAASDVEEQVRCER